MTISKKTTRKYTNKLYCSEGYDEMRMNNELEPQLREVHATTQDLVAAQIKFVVSSMNGLLAY